MSAEWIVLITMYISTGVLFGITRASRVYEFNKTMLKESTLGGLALIFALCVIFWLPSLLANLAIKSGE